MARRGENQHIAATLLFMAGLLVASSRAHSKDDLFPTYRDEETGRFGVISLTGSTSNYTINLSGIILLSLSLSAAVMIWGYLYTLFDNTNKSGSSGGGGDYSYNGGGGYKLSPSTTSMNYTMNLSGLLFLGLGVAAATMIWAGIDAQAASNSLRHLKRSIDDDDGLASLPVVLNNIHRRFEEAAVDELICRQRIICEAAAAIDESSSVTTFGHAINRFFKSVNSEQLMDDKQGGRSYLTAWLEGSKKRAACPVTYKGCLMKSESIKKFLQESE